MTRIVGEDHDHDEFVGCSFSGAVFRESEFTGARLVGVWADSLRIESFAGELDGPVYVDGIDVTAFVTAELDKQFPERVLVRNAHTPDQVRAAWALLMREWDATLIRAGALPAETLAESVAGEWSFLQTLRHLIFAIDTWVGHMLEEPQGEWHPWGQPFLGFAHEDSASIGLELSATPSLDEVVDALRGRWDRMSTQVDALTDESIGEVRAAQADPERFVTETRGHCLATLLNEHAEHRRYAVRDLDLLTTSHS